MLANRNSTVTCIQIIHSLSFIKFTLSLIIYKKDILLTIYGTDVLAKYNMTPQPFKAGIWYNIALKYVTRSSKCLKDIKIEVSLQSPLTIGFISFQFNHNVLT